MEHFIFAFTLVIVILNLIQLISIIAGNIISYPCFGILAPDHWLFFYPSALYQSWYWSGILIFN